MSWLARSLVNSLRPDPADPTDSADSADPQQPESPTRGVKEDLSELSQTLSRHFRGFSSFLAPPPAPPPPDSAAAADSAEAAAREDTGFAAMRSDLAEIGGRVRSGISMLSGNKAVSEISKIASTIFGSEEGDEEEGEGGEVGVTEEVVGFVGNVSMHPETWLDFPLLAEFDDDSDDFYMSDAQQEHALAVERLVPRLAALRIELCPSHMNEDCFWKIYFVLLHPRLSKQDAELLSTPQIVQARAMLLHDLQTRTRMDTQGVGIDPSLPREERATLDASGDDVESPSIIPDKTTLLNAHPPEKLNTSVPSTEIETDKHPIETTEVRIVEKSVIEEEPTTQVKDKSIPVVASKASTQSYEEDGDEWLEEETGETSLSGRNPVLLGDEEDVSFSDLEVEDDDDEELHVTSRTKRDSTDSSTKKADWIEQNKGSDGGSSPPTRGSNDWLDVDIDTV